MATARSVTLVTHSSLHLLVESGRFSNLKTLDLSECDIYELKNVLQRIAGLQNLDGLLLQGNPCSVVRSYKDIILNTFPNLMYLDGTEITKADRQLRDNYLETTDSVDLIFQCPELNGLPKPPKAEKKVKQTIHVEVILPLFQEDVTEETDDVLNSNTPSKKLKKDKSGESKVKSKGSSKSQSTKGKTSLYDKENEYNPKVKNNAFVTERKPWSNNLTFSPIVLKSPENNLYAYRDSFRSCVNVRIVYLKFLPPVQKKQSKKAKKKGKDKKSKRDKKSEKSKSKQQKSKKAKDKKSKSDKSSKADSKTEKEIKKEEPKETILKRVTLVNFYCDLFSINWKDDELNFCWFEEPEFGDKAVEYKSYLEDLRKKEEEKLRVELEEKRKKEEQQKKEKEKKKNEKNVKDKKSKKSNKTKKSKKSVKSKKTKKSKKSKSSKNSKKDKPLSCLVTFGFSRNGKDIKIMQTEVKSKTASKGKKKGKKKK